MTIALLILAVVFLVAGISRVVEIRAAGISERQAKFLVPIHILGCVLFSASIALLALDPSQEHRALMSALFFGAVFTLFPLHIYVAIKRKILLKK